jgi:hypothetical protein
MTTTHILFLQREMACYVSPGVRRLNVVLRSVGEPPYLNLAALGIVSTTVPDGPNKIFIGVRHTPRGALNAFRNSSTSSGYLFDVVCTGFAVSFVGRAGEGAVRIVRSAESLSLGTPQRVVHLHAESSTVT